MNFYKSSWQKPSDAYHEEDSKGYSQGKFEMDIIGVTHIAISSLIGVARSLKDHVESHKEVKELLENVQPAAQRIYANISLLHDLLKSPRSSTPFFDEIIRDIDVVSEELNSILQQARQLKSISVFFRSPSLAGKLRNASEKLKFYDGALHIVGMIANVVKDSSGAISREVSGKVSSAVRQEVSMVRREVSAVRDEVCAALEKLVSHPFNMNCIHSLQASLQGGSESRIVGIGNRGPLSDIITSQKDGFVQFSRGKTVYEQKSPDYSLSFRCFSEAYDTGSLKAAFYLGEQYYNGQGVKKDFEKAFEFYQIGARKGDAESLCRVGWCFSAGHGTECDLVRAVQYQKLAYEAGSAEGAFRYGSALLNGRSIRADPKKAVRLLTEASDRGILSAKMHLARCYECGIEVECRSLNRAFYYAKDAYDGKAYDSWTVGRFYENSLGVEQDLVQAARIYRETFEKGGLEGKRAQSYFAMCLIRGRGIEKNEKEGLRLLREGCIPKNSMGFRFLGDCYRFGYGVSKNLNQAAINYNRAIFENRGMTSLIHAYRSLGEMCEKGEGLSHILNEPLHYFLYAADRYDAESQWKVALRFEAGQGVDVHLDRASFYFNLSARGGHLQARAKAVEYDLAGHGIERTRTSIVEAMEEASERGNTTAKQILGRMGILRTTRRK